MHFVERCKWICITAGALIPDGESPPHPRKNGTVPVISTRMGSGQSGELCTYARAQDSMVSLRYDVRFEMNFDVLTTV